HSILNSRKYFDGIFNIYTLPVFSLSLIMEPLQYVVEHIANSDISQKGIEYLADIMCLLLCAIGQSKDKVCKLFAKLLLKHFTDLSSIEAEIIVTTLVNAAKNHK
ncbi:hypothetical protein PFISCL1PPCAC_902, partial [Pristionchus fissidentatus]